MKITLINNLVTDDARPDFGGNVHGGDPDTWCPTVWTELMRRFNVGSVLDVDCGEGHAVKWFRDRGLLAEGIDALPLNVERAVTPIQLWDVTEGSLFHSCDLVWCCEVAEHIAPAYVDGLLDNLTNGRVVAMTHALPGQGGWHHVHCMPAEYWVSKMEDRGYALVADNAWWREIARLDGEGNYFAQSGLVFQ